MTTCYSLKNINTAITFKVIQLTDLHGSQEVDLLPNSPFQTHTILLMATGHT